MTNRATTDYLASAVSTPLAMALPGSMDSELLHVAYGGRFLTRPVFLDAHQMAGLGRDLDMIFDLLTRLPQWTTDGDLAAYARLVGMTPRQADAVQRTAGERAVRLGRSDLYHDGSGFRLLEFNISSALGGFENAELNRAALACTGLREHVEEHQLAYSDTLAEIVGTMLDHLRTEPAGERPFVAIVDTPSAFRSLERRLTFMARALADHGVDAVAVHAGEVKEKDGRLVVDDRVVDIVYRFFIIEDLLEDGPETVLLDPIFQAHERGTVTLFAPLDTEMYGNKRALALLSDERLRDRMNDAERELVDRFLPWTRRWQPGPVTVDGRQTDLFEYCAEHRADLVLKPSLLHGGHGVVAGWRLSDQEWRDAMDAVGDQPYVVQRRVVPAPEEFPGGTRKVLNWGVFYARGHYAGAIVRGVDDPDVGVVSMGNGARVGCTFHQTGQE